MQTSSALKIFISYSHKDEAFKDELVTMLTGLQRRKIVDAWQDRRIEAGDDWNQSIQTAMDECDLARCSSAPIISLHASSRSKNSPNSCSVAKK